MTLSRRCGGPSMRMGAKAGITLSLPSGRFGNTVTPKLGQRGFRPSARSSESIGKFDRIPPSTNVEVNPVVLLQRDRTEEERDRHRRAHRVGHRLFVGVEAVDPAVVPWQPHQLPRRHIGDRDDQLVALLWGQAVVADGQIAETCARRDSPAGCGPSRGRNRPCRCRSPAAPPTMGRAPEDVRAGRDR